MNIGGGATKRLRAMNANPICRMDTSMGMAGGSLAEMNYGRLAQSRASHAATWTAPHGVRSHPVPVALTRVFHPRRVEGRAPASLVVLRKLDRSLYGACPRRRSDRILAIRLIVVGLVGLAYEGITDTSRRRTTN